MMKYITPATDRRIKRLQKEWIHTSFINGDKYGAFVWNACDILKDILEKHMSLCCTCDLKELKTENSMQIGVPKSSEVIFRFLENRYSDLVSCTFCLDLHSVTITDFNKLIRVIEKDADEIDHYRWF